MIVVFGAAGFIGTYVIDQLLGQGYEVLASDVSDIGETFYRRRGVPFESVDITQRAALDRLARPGVEAVIHLACVQPANISEKAYDAADYVRVNVLGTLNILDFCRAHSVPKIIYTASHRNTQGMWERKAGEPIREDEGRAIKFTGEYAMFSISESAATDCVEHYAQSFGIEGITLRLPPVYGYGPHTIIFKDGAPLKTGFQVFIENAQNGRPLELWGNPENGRDIVYVKDVAAAIVLAVQKRGVGGLYNIASGHRLTLREQAECIATLFSPEGHPAQFTFRPDRPNNIENYVYDISKARRVLGWQPKYSFSEMLLDYQTEMRSERFAFLVEKRMQMMRDAAS